MAGVPDRQTVEADTARWLERAVIGLNLCPFAKAVWIKQQVRIAVTDADTPDALLDALLDELQRLVTTAADELDTTLLVHPRVLQDFLDFNDFLATCDAALRALKLQGVVQIADFHPDYRFADCEADDPANATNRAPYPTLHLLREASIDRAVAAIPDPAEIFERNIARLRELGAEGWRGLGVGPTPPRAD